MQATMSTVESYGAADNGAGAGPTMHSPFDGGAAAVYKPAMPPTPPHLAAPISSYPAADGSAAGESPAVDGGKKKRGRPRKYAVAAPEPLRAQAESGFAAAGEFSPPEKATVTPNGKRMGRPPGSRNKPKVAPMASMGSSGAGLTPHIITIQAGEDVSSKIMSFPLNGLRAICILSANGVISNVTLRQASSSGGTVNYEGRFEILSLSGSYTVLESGSQRSRTGGLSVLLAGPDGRVLGGGVAGVLIAAGPVQVVVGGFTVGQGSMTPNKVDYSSGPAKPMTGSPALRGTPSESSGSPINQSNDSNPNSMGMMQWK